MSWAFLESWATLNAGTLLALVCVLAVTTLLGLYSHLSQENAKRRLKLAQTSVTDLTVSLFHTAKDRDAALQVQYEVELWQREEQAARDFIQEIRDAAGIDRGVCVLSTIRHLVKNQATPYYHTLVSKVQVLEQENAGLRSQVKNQRECLEKLADITGVREDVLGSLKVVEEFKLNACRAERLEWEVADLQERNSSQEEGFTRLQKILELDDVVIQDIVQEVGDLRIRLGGLATCLGVQGLSRLAQETRARTLVQFRHDVTDAVGGAVGAPLPSVLHNVKVHVERAPLADQAGRLEREISDLQDTLKRMEVRSTEIINREVRSTEIIKAQELRLKYMEKQRVELLDILEPPHGQSLEARARDIVGKVEFIEKSVRKQAFRDASDMLAREGNR